MNYRERLMEMETERRLCSQLQEFERKYSLDSDTFYERFESGQLGDEIDYFDWAAAYEMVRNLGDRGERIFRFFWSWINDLWYRGV